MQDKFDRALSTIDTGKDYCEFLRHLGRALADGSLPEYKLDVTLLAEKMDADEHYKALRSTSYSRTIINRVPEVKAIGNISIKASEDTFAKYYTFTLNKEPRKRVITNDDLPHIKAKAVSKVLKRLIETIPNVMDLQGDELKGAQVAINRYHDMIRRITEEMETD